MSSYTWPPLSGGSVAGVSSLNLETGDVVIVAGTGISVTPSGQNITIAASGSGSVPGGTNGQVQFNDSGVFGGFGSWNGTTFGITGNIAASANLHIFGTSIMAGDVVVQGGFSASGTLGFYGASEIAQPTGDIFSALTTLNLIATPSLNISSITGTTNSTITTLSSLALPANQLSGVGNLTDTGTDGITVGNGASAVIGTGTTISQHVADTTHNGYLSSTDWNTFNGKTSNGITALTGDGTASGPGSAALTLASVATPGTTGSSTAIPVVTINAKGLTTSITTAAVIAPAGTLSGTTLNSTVITSSLTTVGTIGTGTWAGTTLAVNHGGTGLATLTANNVILGNGTSNPTFVAPGTSGNVLTSNGSTWTSAAPPTGVITVWSTSLTLTPNNFGTISGASYYTRQVGDSLEVRGTFAAGISLGAAASISLPAGLTIDSAKIPNTTFQVGDVYIPSQSSLIIAWGAGYYTAFWDGSDTSNIYLATSGSTNTFSKVNANSIASLAQVVDFNFSVPISQY